MRRIATSDFISEDESEMEEATTTSRKTTSTFEIEISICKDFQFMENISSQ